MDTTLLAMEKENKKKGMRNSIILHLLLLLLCWFYAWPASVPKPQPIVVDIEFAESPLVDFAMEDSSKSKAAKADEGKARAKTEEVKQVKTTPTEVKVETKVTPPTPPTPVKDVTPTAPMVAEVLDEESPVEAIEEEMEFDEPEEEVIPETVEVEEVVKPSKPSKPAVVTAPTGKNTSDSETGTDKPSTIDGSEDGTGKGDKGDGDGVDSGNDGDSGLGDEGAGTGEYDGSGDGVFGRKVVYRNHAQLAQVISSGSGKIYVKVCINRIGQATYTEIDNFNTTIKTKATLKKALQMIKGYRFEPDPTAPKEQCGMIKLFLDINALK